MADAIRRSSQPLADHGIDILLNARIKQVSGMQVLSSRGNSRASVFSFEFRRGHGRSLSDQERNEDYKPAFRKLCGF
jgi:hypothetical protein